MADSRIKDLTDEVISSEIAALLDTLFIAVDDTSFADSKKILLKTILTGAIVSTNTNNYQAMSPKAFYDSVMTTSRKGIGLLSANTNVTDKTGTGLLNSIHQVLMQAQWALDWFVGNGHSEAHKRNAEDYVNVTAMAFDGVWEGNLGAGGFQPLQPISKPSSVLFEAAYCTIALTIGTANYAGSYGIASTAGILKTVLIGGGVHLAINNTNEAIGIYVPSAISNIKISMHTNATFI